MVPQAAQTQRQPARQRWPTHHHCWQLPSQAAPAHQTRPTQPARAARQLARRAAGSRRRPTPKSGPPRPTAPATRTARSGGLAPPCPWPRAPPPAAAGTGGARQTRAPRKTVCAQTRSPPSPSPWRGTGRRGGAGRRASSAPGRCPWRPVFWACGGGEERKSVAVLFPTLVLSQLTALPPFSMDSISSGLNVAMDTPLTRWLNWRLCVFGVKSGVNGCTGVSGCAAFFANTRINTHCTPLHTVHTNTLKSVTTYWGPCV